MIRLTLILVATVFLTLLIAGQDRGQLRDGLRLADTPAPKPVQVAVAEPVAAKPVAAEPVAVVREVVFVPQQPVVRTPAISPVEPPPAPVVAQPEPVPQIVAQPEATLRYVAARSANVRGGPSTGAAVVGNLRNGEAVLLVAEDNPVAGWSRVRIEGDGIDGYVATRLLSADEPAAN